MLFDNFGEQRRSWKAIFIHIDQRLDVVVLLEAAKY
jgi:hypothetical protein